MAILEIKHGVVPRFLSGVLRGELQQPYLVINVTGLVETTEPSSFWEKFELHLTSTCPLELFGAEYICETNISIFISHLWLFAL